MALSSQQVPVVKTLRRRPEMPLADDRRLVATLLQELWKGHLIGIELVSILSEPILVAMQTCLDHSAAGTTNGIGTKTILEQHPLIRQPVNVWRRIDVFQKTAVGPDGMGRMVIAKYENDVRPLTGRISCPKHT